jgi:type VI secretion system secreted protein Hcp
MAVNCVIKAEGITGNSSILEGAIQVFSYSFGGSNPSSMGTSAGDSRSGKPNFSDLSIMKALDATSPYFFEKMCKCAAIPELSLKYFKNIENQNTLYIEYKLTNVYVSSQQQSGSEENPTESLSFNFDKIEFSYYKEKPDNKGVELETTKGYNIRTNESS